MLRGKNFIERSLRAETIKKYKLSTAWTTVFDG